MYSVFFHKKDKQEIQKFSTVYLDLYQNISLLSTVLLLDIILLHRVFLMFELHRVFLLAAMMRKVTLEKRLYTRTHATNHIAHTLLQSLEGHLGVSLLVECTEKIDTYVVTDQRPCSLYPRTCYYQTSLQLSYSCKYQFGTYSYNRGLHAPRRAEGSFGHAHNSVTSSAMVILREVLPTT